LQQSERKKSYEKAKVVARLSWLVWSRIKGRKLFLKISPLLFQPLSANIVPVQHDADANFFSVSDQRPNLAIKDLQNVFLA